MASDNWNDDRLDDKFSGLEGDIKTSEEAIKYLALEVNTLKNQMQNLIDDIAAHTSGRFNWWMIAATMSNSFTAVVVYFISKGK